MNFIEKKAKPAAPLIDAALVKMSLEVLYLDEEDVYGGEFLRSEAVEKNWTVINVDKCRFVGCDFADSKLRNVNLTDIIFENCNFSNVVFDEIGFSKVVFKGCKMTGASILKSFLSSVVFEECLSKHFMIDESKYRDLSVTKCEFESWSVYDCRGMRLSLKENSLVGWDTRGVSYKGVDLSDNILEGITLELSGLVGAKISTLQACMIASMLGLEVG